MKICKLHPGAITPTYGTDGAACFDIYAIDCGDQTPIYAGGRHVLFRTGLSFEFPSGHVMLVFSRSGHGFKHGVRLSNCVGVIDSDYRGELMVKLVNDNHQTDVLRVSHGDRIAQAMVIPIGKTYFEIVDSLSETDRGSGGLGSTGK